MECQNLYLIIIVHYNVRLNRDSQSGTLRNANDFELIGASAAFGQNSLFHRGNQMYNNLPREVKNESKKTKSEEKLKEYVEHVSRITICEKIRLFVFEMPSIHQFFGTFINENE